MSYVYVRKLLLLMIGTFEYKFEAKFVTKDK